jgi:hypothetical protein
MPARAHCAHGETSTQASRAQQHAQNGAAAKGKTLTEEFRPALFFFVDSHGCLTPAQTKSLKTF